MRDWLVYTGLRLLLLACVAAVLLVAGLSGFPLVLTALLASSVLSLFMLGPQRQALVRRQAERSAARRADADRLRARLDEDTDSVG